MILIKILNEILIKRETKRIILVFYEELSFLSDNKTNALELSLFTMSFPLKYWI